MTFLQLSLDEHMSLWAQKIIPHANLYPKDAVGYDFAWIFAQVAQARYMSGSKLTFALLRNLSDLHIYKGLYGECNEPEKNETLPLNYNKNRLPEFQHHFLCVLCDFLTDLEWFSVV